MLFFYHLFALVSCQNMSDAIHHEAKRKARCLISQSQPFAARPCHVSVNDLCAPPPRAGFYDVPNVSRSEQLTPLNPGPGDRGRSGSGQGSTHGPRQNTYLPPAWTEAASQTEGHSAAAGRGWLWLWTQVLTQAWLWSLGEESRMTWLAGNLEE